MLIKTKVQRKFNFLILIFTAFLALYIIEINDWILNYELLIDIPLILTIITSIVLLILTIIDAKKFNQLPSKVSILIFVVLLAVSVSIYGNRNGMFWGKKIISATFLDDRSRIDLKLYENGKFLIYSNWLFGEDRFEGNFKLNGDTIIFNKSPITDNDFIERKIVIDRHAKKIYFKKRIGENYDKSFYYFQVDY